MKLYQYIIVAAAALAVLAVIYMGINSASSQTVGLGDNISVYYTGTFTNGTVFDSNVGKQPLEFTVGSGEMIKGFDQGVIGMRLNQPKTITIPANEAYGVVNPALIVRIPLSEFKNQTISVGNTITETGNGQTAQGIVTSVNSTTATIDFNSPLAGQTLIFNITVVKIVKK